jgi:hypothetical protein
MVCVNAGCSSAKRSTCNGSRPATNQCVPGCSTRSKSPLRSSRPRSFFFTVTRWIFMVFSFFERVLNGGAASGAVAGDGFLVLGAGVEPATDD